MKITCADIKAYLDKYIDKFKASGAGIEWDGYEADPCYSNYLFSYDGNEIGYMGVCFFNQNDKIESIDDLMLDISISVGLRINSTIKYKKNGSKTVKNKIAFDSESTFGLATVDEAANILKGLILDYKTAKINERKLEAQGDF